MSEDLDRDRILSAPDTTQPVPVEVPEWGGVVYIREITAAERDAWEMRFIGGGPGRTQNIRAGLLVYALCDREGKRLFADEDIGRLGRKSAKVLDRLFDIARRVNGLMVEDLEAARADFPAGRP